MQYPLDKNVVDLDKYEGHLISGLRGSGKSALLEVLGELHFLEGRRIVLDLLDASDMESCFWAVPGKNRYFYETLLLHPPWLEVKHTRPDLWSHIKPMSTDVELETILKTAREEDRIVTLPSKLWPRGSVTTILSEYLYQLPDVADRVKTPLCVLMREAHLAFSQLKVFPEQEKNFKRALIYFFRHGRHHRTSLILDLQRSIDLHKAVRSIVDRNHIKKNTSRSIPAELNWIFSELEEIRSHFRRRQWKLREQNYPTVQRLYPSEFYALDAEESVRCVERFMLPRFRHKHPEDDFMQLTGIVFKQVAELPDLEQDNGNLPPVKEQIYRCKLEHPDWGPRRIARELECSNSYVSDVLSFLKDS